MLDKPSITILWTIENVGHCFQKVTEALESQVFYVDILSQSEWYLGIYPNVRADDDEIKVFLYNVSCNEGNRMFIDYELSFLSKDDSVLWTGEAKNIEVKPQTALGITGCPSREEIFKNRVEEYLSLGTLTLRCRIWKLKESLKYTTLYNVFTRIEIERRIFHWPIEEFSELRINEKKITNRIGIGEKDQAFCVELSFSGARANVDIKQVNKNEWRNFFTCKILVVDKEGIIVQESGDESYFFEPESRIWNFPWFPTFNELPARKCQCLESDVLNLLFILTITTGENSNVECVTNLPPWIQIPFSHDFCVGKHLQYKAVSDVPGSTDGNNEGEIFAILQKDYLSLYKDRSLSDFELRSEAASFPVHKSVLAARSPVFKVMFSSLVKEGDNFMDVPDVDADTLDKLLLFIYAGNVVNMDWSSASKLYYAADKYDVFSLKQKCSALLSDNISDSNVCDILLHADRHNDDVLKSSVHNFIVLNDVRVILSNEWKQFLENNPALGAETMRLIYAKKIGMLAK